MAKFKKTPLPISDSSFRKDDDNTIDLNMLLDHADLADRIKKTLYYGKCPKTDRPSLPMTEIAVELFGKAVPESIGDIDMYYAASVSRNACISPCSMILALVYLKRLQRRDPNYLQHVTSSDLFLVSMMVASKFLYDEGEEEEVFNIEWANSANIDVKEINKLEREFLTAVKWEVYVNSKVFAKVLKEIEFQIAWNNGIHRGWFSYTDLAILMKVLKINATCNVLFENVVKVVLVLMVAYTISILTVVGSAVLAFRLHSAFIVQRNVAINYPMKTYSCCFNSQQPVSIHSQEFDSLKMVNRIDEVASYQRKVSRQLMKSSCSAECDKPTTTSFVTLGSICVCPLCRNEIPVNKTDSNAGCFPCHAPQIEATGISESDFIPAYKLLYNLTFMNFDLPNTIKPYKNIPRLVKASKDKIVQKTAMSLSHQYSVSLPGNSLFKYIM